MTRDDNKTSAAPTAKAAAPRVPGSLAGQITIADDFDAPMSFRPALDEVISEHAELLTRLDK